MQRICFQATALMLGLAACQSEPKLPPSDPAAKPAAQADPKTGARPDASKGASGSDETELVPSMKGQPDFVATLLSKIPSKYDPQPGLAPEELDLVDGQIFVRFSSDSRATFWHIVDWGSIETADKVVNRRERVGPTKEGHTLFDARFGTTVVQGSAPASELPAIEDALQADAFVSFEP